MEGKEQRLWHHRNMGSERIKEDQKRGTGNRIDIHGMLINAQGTGLDVLCAYSLLIRTLKGYN